MNQIKNRFTGDVITEGDKTIRELASEKRAYLRDAYLRGAYLRGAYLRDADLRGADLRGADLRGADLRDADLRDADLRDADLRDAKIEFHKFPSIRLLSSISLGTLSDDLTTELFRRDVFSHPAPNAEQLFSDWATGGSCPYSNQERFWLFDLRQECWKPGLPTMKDSDLIFAICKEKGWKIKGYTD